MRCQDVAVQWGVGAAAADGIAADAEAARTTALATAKAAADRAIGQVAAENEHARLGAHHGTSRDVLLALALTELAGNLPAVDQLVLTPDLMTSLISRLASSSTSQA